MGKTSSEKAFRPTGFEFFQEKVAVFFMIFPKSKVGG